MAIKEPRLLYHHSSEYVKVSNEIDMKDLWMANNPCITSDEGLLDVMAVNTLRSTKHGCHFSDDVLHVFSWMKMYYKPLSEPMIIVLLMHIGVTWPQ